MKKTFTLNIEGKHPERLLEAIKHEVRKYVKRERRKTLPPATDYWTFDCRFGATAADSSELRLSEITRAMDALVAAGVTEFYVEILARAVVKPVREEADEDEFGE
jgi:hypothetical protein